MRRMATREDSGEDEVEGDEHTRLLRQLLVQVSGLQRSIEATQQVGGQMIV